MKNHPDPIKPVIGIAKTYVAMKQHDKAVAVCDEYLADRPNDFRLSMIKAEILIREGKSKEGEAILEKMISENPDSTTPLMVMAHVNRRKRDYSRALEYNLKAIEVSPKNLEARMGIAGIHLEMGDFDAAVKAYEDLLKINDSYGPAANNLAYLYAEQGKNLDRAVELANKAKELMPENPDIADTLGYVYLKKGSFLLAKKAFNEGIRLSPNNPLLHYHLGLLFYEEKDFSSATLELQTALKLGLGQKEKGEIEEVLKKMREKK
ncbi:tetratricopeptide repeat protein [Thermodesulfobacteriota bacterium]